MNTLKDMLTAITKASTDYDADLIAKALVADPLIRVALYGVAQKRIVRVEQIVEATGPKIVLYLEEFDETERDEKIRAISG